MNRLMRISLIVNIWRNSGVSELPFEENPLLPGAAGLMGISFSVNEGHWPNVAFGKSLLNWVRQQSWLPPSVHTTCVIRLPKHCSILLPTDLTDPRCLFQLFSNCLAMLILQRQPSTRGCLLMTWRG
ncbi:MAG TPA: hypothetical protein VGT44_04855 [Ktedonobacteraceae bacterium]|nr:hypothetical protein [Ktedonobacteraceae bacterium]